MKISTLLKAALAVFFLASAAQAQQGGTVTQHAFAIGRGAGQTGFVSLLCGSAQLAVGQIAAAPICRTVTGDVTIDAAGVTAIGADKVTVAMIADAELKALAGVTSAADKCPYFTGSGTATVADCTTFGRSLWDDADATAGRVTLGVVIGTNVQAFDADLSALAANATDGLWAHTAAGTGAARTLTAPAAGLTITNPAGIAGNPTFALANDLAALEALGSTGFAARTTTDTWAQRTLTAPAAGLTITNPAGVAGNPTFALANDLAGVEGLASNGCAARTATDTWAVRTVTGTANQITVTNGDCVAGNPTISIPASPVFTGTATPSEAFALTGDISPAQLVANTNDWAPTGFSTASTVRLSTDASRNITGLAGGADGRIIILHNVGAQDAVLKNSDALSTAANRFLFGGDVTLLANYSITLRYDATDSRWRAITTASAGGGGGGTVTSAVIVGAGLTVNSGTCTITTSGTCTLTTTAADQTAMTNQTATSAVVASNGFPRLVASGTGSGASLNIVLTGLTSFRGIKIYLYNCLPASDATLYMRTSTNGGSSYDSGATDYRYAMSSVQDDSSTVTGINSTGAAQLIPAGTGAIESANGGAQVEVTMFGNTSGSVINKMTWQSVIYDDSVRFRSVVGAGGRNAVADVDAIQFLFSTGNITSCPYAVYAYN